MDSDGDKQATPPSPRPLRQYPLEAALTTDEPWQAVSRDSLAFAGSSVFDYYWMENLIGFVPRYGAPYHPWIPTFSRCNYTENQGMFNVEVGGNGWGVAWNRVRLSLPGPLPQDYEENYLQVTKRWNRDNFDEPPTVVDVPPVKMTLRKGQTKGDWLYLTPVSLDDEILTINLLPVEVKVYKKGESAPLDGVCVKKNDTLVYQLSDLPENQFPIEGEKIVWFKRQLVGDGTFTDWESWPIAGTEGKGVKFESDAKESGIFQVKAKLTTTSGSIEVQYIRKSNDAHGTSSKGVFNDEVYAAGKPDYVGVTDDEIHLKLRNAAKNKLGSEDYSDAKPVLAWTGGPTIPVGTSKCNIFVYQMGQSVGAAVPHINTVLGFPIWTMPPFAYDWWKVGITIPGWPNLGQTTKPWPGQVISDNIGTIDSGGQHVGIVDYDGGMINAGSANVNKQPHPSTPKLVTPHYRKYQP